MNAGLKKSTVMSNDPDIQIYERWNTSKFYDIQAWKINNIKID